MTVKIYKTIETWVWPWWASEFNWVRSDATSYPIRSSQKLIIDSDKWVLLESDDTDPGLNFLLMRDQYQPSSSYRNRPVDPVDIRRALNKIFATRYHSQNVYTLGDHGFRYCTIVPGPGFDSQDTYYFNQASVRRAEQMADITYQLTSTEPDNPVPIYWDIIPEIEIEFIKHGVPLCGYRMDDYTATDWAAYNVVLLPNTEMVPEKAQLLSIIPLGSHPYTSKRRASNAEQSPANFQLYKDGDVFFGVYTPWSIKTSGFPVYTVPFDPSFLGDVGLAGHVQCRYARTITGAGTTILDHHINQTNMCDYRGYMVNNCKAFNRWYAGPEELYRIVAKDSDAPQAQMRTNYIDRAPYKIVPGGSSERIRVGGSNIGGRSERALNLNGIPFHGTLFCSVIPRRISARTGDWTSPLSQASTRVVDLLSFQLKFPRRNGFDMLVMLVKSLPKVVRNALIIADGCPDVSLDTIPSPLKDLGFNKVILPTYVDPSRDKAWINAGFKVSRSCRRDTATALLQSVLTDRIPQAQIPIAETPEQCTSVLRERFYKKLEASGASQARQYAEDLLRLIGERERRILAVLICMAACVKPKNYPDYTGRPDWIRWLGWE